MIVSINQPAYLPWPGFYDRIVKSDLHIILDHVQFEKNSLTNRNKIKTAQGWSWLTVPVKTKGKFKDSPLSELEVNETDRWAKKHLQGLKSNYAKAPFFKDHIGFFEELYGRDWTHLMPLLEETNTYLMDALQIKTDTIKSSSLAPQNTKSDLVLELCQNVGATTYISGPFGRDYLDIESFNSANIDVLFHEYEPKPYTQLYGEFEPYMSVLDLLMNCGPESAQHLQNSANSLKTS